MLSLQKFQSSVKEKSPLVYVFLNFASLELKPECLEISNFSLTTPRNIALLNSLSLSILNVPIKLCEEETLSGENLMNCVREVFRVSRNIQDNLFIERSRNIAL